MLRMILMCVLFGAERIENSVSGRVGSRCCRDIHVDVIESNWMRRTRSEGRCWSPTLGVGGLTCRWEPKPCSEGDCLGGRGGGEDLPPRAAPTSGLHLRPHSALQRAVSPRLKNFSGRVVVMFCGELDRSLIVIGRSYCFSSS